MKVRCEQGLFWFSIFVANYSFLNLHISSCSMDLFMCCPKGLRRD